MIVEVSDNLMGEDIKIKNIQIEVIFFTKKKPTCSRENHYVQQYYVEDRCHTQILQLLIYISPHHIVYTPAPVPHSYSRNIRKYYVIFTFCFSVLSMFGICLFSVRCLFGLHFVSVSSPFCLPFVSFSSLLCLPFCLPF